MLEIFIEIVFIHSMRTWYGTDIPHKLQADANVTELSVRNRCYITEIFSILGCVVRVALRSHCLCACVLCSGCVRILVAWYGCAYELRDCGHFDVTLTATLAFIAIYVCAYFFFFFLRQLQMLLLHLSSVMLASCISETHINTVCHPYPHTHTHSYIRIYIQLALLDTFSSSSRKHNITRDDANLPHQHIFLLALHIFSRYIIFIISAYYFFLDFWQNINQPW